MVSACMGEFETGMSRDGQTREHVLLAYTMGVKQLIVAVNKMDAEDVSYSEDHFHKIKTEVSSYIIKVGYQPEHVAFVPISGRHNENLFEVSDRMPWFQGWTLKRKEYIVTGKTLMEALDAITVPQRPTNKPFRLSVQDVYEIADVGTVIVGRVETGVLKLNMVVRFAPPSITATVQSIEMHQTSIEGKSIFSRSSEVMFICRGRTW
jgi:elongation factor 1-alpha